jgi:hypothetical protein
MTGWVAGVMAWLVIAPPVGVLIGRSIRVGQTTSGGNPTAPRRFAAPRGRGRSIP